MGKASSSKKVARAARAGSTHKGPERRELGFPLAIALTVLLGTSLVLYARGNRSEAVEPQANKTHWHAAYGIWNCDHWEPNLSGTQDADGIHSHDDGIVHIHPFNTGAAGTRANLGVFFDNFGVKASNDKIDLGTGVALENGTDCNGKKAVLEVARFKADQPDAQPEIITSNFDNIRFREDREAFTIALIPEGETVPRPESIPTLDALSDLGTTASTTTTVPGATTTTIPGETTTTVAPAPTTTTAG
ncbi:MAG TPA: hypothetical protein VGQ20_05185 [Acidimicrobiales bacterium]|nr:hypothetical protein [Acidimicrobiales bacterium]